MCGQPEDAEEVAQETLLKVFENFDQLREPERVRPWIFRIAKNACLMQRRKSVFAPAHELSLDELAPTVDIAGPEIPPDAEFLRTELRAVLDRVIAELPVPLPGGSAAAGYRGALHRGYRPHSGREHGRGEDAAAPRPAAMRQKLDCYVHHHCLEDQPPPNPKPLTAAERERLFSVWSVSKNSAVR